MSNKSNDRNFSLICKMCILILLVLFALIVIFRISSFRKANETSTENTVNNATKNPTSEETAQIVNITQTPIAEETVSAINPTQMPIYIVITTASPTKIPEVTETPVIPESPSESATQEVSTVDPTVQPTEIPTSEPTPEITITPTPLPDEEERGKLFNEFDSLTMMGGIYPNYDLEPAYDLYDYISTDIISQEDLWNIIEQPFANYIVRWIKMDFIEEGSISERLKFALDSSICEECGRVEIGDNSSNIDSIMELFSEIDGNKTFKAGNDILLDYLYKYTVKNPDNPYERLFIACKGH